MLTDMIVEEEFEIKEEEPWYDKQDLEHGRASSQPLSLCDFTRDILRVSVSLTAADETLAACEHFLMVLSCRPAAGGRAREDSSGEEPGAGAAPAADVLQQPGTAAGDRGKRERERSRQCLSRLKRLLSQKWNKCLR